MPCPIQQEHRTLKAGLISSPPIVSKRLTLCTCTAPPVLITSRPYSIAGVTGFHRGTKPTVTGFSQPERRLKPVTHKNVGASRINNDPKVPKDANASGRGRGRIPDGIATKSSARRTRAVAQVASSRKRHLLTNQHRKYFVASAILLKTDSQGKNSQVDSAIFANIVFEKTSSNKYHQLAVQHGEYVLVDYNSTS
jgi:hypothetical protein